MVHLKRIVALSLAVCSMAPIQGVESIPENAIEALVDSIVIEEQPIVGWNSDGPQAILVMQNLTQGDIRSVQLDGKVVRLNPRDVDRSTTVELSFDEVCRAVCRVQVSNQSAKFIARKGYCYVCQLLDEDSVPLAWTEGPEGFAETPPDASVLKKNLNLNRGSFNKEKAQLDELNRRFDDLDKDCKWLDGTITQMKLEQSHLTHEQKSLLALRDNMATLQEPSIANELATVRTAIDTRLQTLIKDLQAKELALAPLQAQLAHANIQAEDLASQLKESKSAMETLDRKYRSLRRSQMP